MAQQCQGDHRNAVPAAIGMLAGGDYCTVHDVVGELLLQPLQMSELMVSEIRGKLHLKSNDLALITLNDQVNLFAPPTTCAQMTDSRSRSIVQHRLEFFE